MILLTTDWGQAWTMASISVGVVFCILLLIVCVLVVFSRLAQDKPVKPAAAAPVATLAGSPKSSRMASGADEAAVAMAVYLYLNGRHDEESGVLTIQVNEHSLWHEELNERL